ncbi:MAG: hypothetical protein DWQ01_10945 [Planctomycetota bacterium]|nr:MAG: hypothetical protein DWQ01_10945 [Planctomycetota bacterium]
MKSIHKVMALATPAMLFLTSVVISAPQQPIDPCPASSVRWSSYFSALQDGDVAVIPTGQVIYLDEQTVQLEGVRIEGTLVFTDCPPSGGGEFPQP